MSKSDSNQNAFVSLLDDRDTIIRKFKRAVTDSEAEVIYDEVNKPGISNLMEIYSCTNDKTYPEIEKEFEGVGYGQFKLAVGESVADDLAKLQSRYNELLANKDYLEDLMKENAQKAQSIAIRTLRKARRRLGII